MTAGEEGEGKMGQMGILMSIRPEWCKKIVTGEKTIEVRKTKPEQIRLPFHVYVYATFGGENWFRFGEHMSGRVIGRFICDDIKYYSIQYPSWNTETDPELIEKSCVNYTKLHKYAEPQGCVYGWHIKDFELYDQPLPVGFFLDSKGMNFRRAPQSWAYAIKC